MATGKREWGARMRPCAAHARKPRRARSHVLCCCPPQKQHLKADAEVRSTTSEACSATHMHIFCSHLPTCYTHTHAHAHTCFATHTRVIGITPAACDTASAASTAASAAAAPPSSSKRTAGVEAPGVEASGVGAHASLWLPAGGSHVPRCGTQASPVNRTAAAEVLLLVQVAQSACTQKSLAYVGF